MELPPGYRLVGAGQAGGGLVRADLADLPLARWWEDGVPLRDARGRGGVQVLDLGGHGRAVARRLHRGGVLRHVLPDAFLDAGRGAAEVCVLVALGAAGVPVVEPLAAVWRGHRGLIAHRLITRLVEDARPLPAFVLAHAERRREAIRTAGRAVSLAFDAGLDHPDLHPDNLLVSIESGRVVVRLLDLDRAQLRPLLAAARRDRMLLRLARYVERHGLAARRVEPLRFLAGMGLPRPQRRAAMQRLVAGYARAVRRHRLIWRARS